MRHICIPEPQELEGINRGGAPIAYGFHDLHREFVWTDAAWLANSDTVAAFDRCREAIVDKTPGTWCGISDADYDIYRPIALRAGTQIAESNPLRIPVLTARIRLLAPVVTAPSKAPEPTPEPEPAPSTE